MGRHDIREASDTAELRAFMRALLDDVQALERMCAEGMIETGVRRIGAEQEMFLVDSAWRPAPLAMEILQRLDDPRITTELGLFNLEMNLTTQNFRKAGLHRLESEVEEGLTKVREVAAELGGDVLLTGILPTLDKRHLGLETMTPLKRYYELNRVLTEMRGGEFQTLIKGIDELQTSHDNVMLEACNTSFQVHFQVGPGEFAHLYNLAQAVTAPVLAAAVNSPVLLGHRLWHETRVALFQQSLDVRSDAHKARGGRQRVSFGDHWIKESVLEIFREDIARFRVILSTDLGEPSMEILERGEVPPLKALCLHNGTIYRWNRPCYGVHDGQAHLRIENRALPAGPTVLDEISNAAFYFGLMSALADEYHDITEVMTFDDAKDNFVSAARYGLKAQFRWLQGEAIPAQELILRDLLPTARQGLETASIEKDEIDRYLGIIEERVASGRTGAQWALESLANLGAIKSKDVRLRSLTAAMAKRQATGQPVHTWEPASEEEEEDWLESYRTVAQVMTTDLFTVHPEDLVDLAASLMEWEHIRHVPVEDHEGRLVGLVSHRALLRLIVRGLAPDSSVAVRDIMRPDPITVTPETSVTDAVETMRKHQCGCLPVVQDGRLVGIVTEHDFLEVASKLFEERMRGE